jgi:hypothetical protein
MRKLLVLAVVGAIGGGGWLFTQGYRIDGLERLKLRPRDGSAAASNAPEDSEHVETKRVVRVGSYKLRDFGLPQLGQPRSMKVLAEVAGSFDLLALEGLVDTGSEVLHALVELINSRGRHYEFVAGPATGEPLKNRDAFLFDTDRIEVDRSEVYAVADPDHLLAHPPLVGWFRVRGLAPDQAITFTLMTVNATAAEQPAIAAAYRAVRDDGRGEDDVILLGDFGADDRHMGPLQQIPRFTAAISGIPTNAQGDCQLDNIVFSRAAAEFTGRAGVFDVVRHFNLTLEEALAVSDHMPVWAEFSAYEGGEAGELARRQQSLR